MDGRAPGEVDRRTLLRAAAWSAPVILLAGAVPAAAASLGTLSITLVTLQLGAGGYPLNLRDGKTLNSNGVNETNTDRTNTTVVVTAFRVTDSDTGSAVAGATCTVDGGPQVDADGFYLISAVTMATIGTVGQSTQKRTAVAVTDADGEVRVKLATGTWAADDCPPGYVGVFQPTPGALSVHVSGAAGYANRTVAFSYLVYDGPPVVGLTNGCR